MKVIIVMGMVLELCVGLGAEGATSESPAGKEGSTINLNELPTVYKFKSLPYAHAAALLQKMGKEKGCELLKKVAERGEEGQVAILCRMLFTKGARAPFRAPYCWGAPIYLGGTDDGDWPLSPLALVDDVPFCVVKSYHLMGEGESSMDYLNFCLENCQWSKTRFDRVSDKTVEKALRSLLASPKWKTRLTGAEQERLRSQAR